MTLAYVTSVTPTSPQGACTNSNNNTVLVINSATLVIYDLPTLTQQHSYAIQNATPSGVSIINSSSAIVCYEGVNTVDLVELSGGFRQSYSGGTSTLIGAQLKGQNIAADPSTNVAFWGSTASNSINRFDGNAFSVSAITLPFHGGSTASFTIMLKSPGRWFVAGNSYSDILEIDSLGNVVDSFSFPLQVFPSTNYDATGATQQVSPPNAISYSNNMLTVSFNNAAFCQMDWSTKTILKIHHPGVGYCLATCASGVTITHPTTLGLQGHLMELDMAIRPMTVRDQLFLDSTAVSIGCDINPATGY